MITLCQSTDGHPFPPGHASRGDDGSHRTPRPHTLTMSLMRRIALTGSEADKTAAERILGSANEQLKALINSQEQ
jgi:hypothetical protein